MDLKKIYEKVFDLCAFPVRVTDETGKVIILNQSYCNMFGVSEDELMGKPLWIVFSEGEQEEIKQMYSEFVSKEEASEKAERIITLKNGEKLYLQGIYNLFKIEGKKFVLSILNDITKKRKAEELLKESEETFRKLYEGSSDSILLLSFDGFQDCNNATLKTFGYKNKEEIIGRKPWEVSPEYQHDGSLSEEKAKQMMNKALKDGYNCFEWMHRKSNGEDFPCEVLLFPIKIKGVQYFYSVVRDITERKKTESKLKESEELYKAIFENTGSFTIIVDEDNTILLANNETLALTGFTPDEIIGTKWTNYVAPESLEMMKKYHKERRVHPEKVPKKYGAKLYNKKGEKRDTLLTVQMIPNTKQSVVSINDITEIKKAKERAEEMSRIKSSFLANMSHELRTPLQGILGFSELIQEENNLQGMKKMAKIIHKSGLRLLNTLNQILNLSLLEAKAKKINYSNIDIVSLIKDVIQLFQPEAKKKNLELNFESKHSTLPCYSDSEIITNILNNLISNSIIYTEKGSVTIKLNEEIIYGKAFIVIDVIDTGIGIEEKYFDIIFDEFRQVSEGYGRSFEGTGLGLSLCKKYLGLLGGEISVESRVGVGSDFKVKIPKLSQHERLEEGLKEEYKVEKTIKKGLEKPKILLVEDEVDCIILINYYLGENYIIDVVKKAIDAIEKVKVNKYSLILMDINLGKGLSGMDAVAEIRKLKEYEKVPIVAMTAFAMKGDREEFLAGGCDEYISKPFTKENLERIVSSLIKEGN